VLQAAKRLAARWLAGMKAKSLTRSDSERIGTARQALAGAAAADPGHVAPRVSAPCAQRIVESQKKSDSFNRRVMVEGRMPPPRQA
jgi:hypothetical protein